MVRMLLVTMAREQRSKFERARGESPVMGTTFVHSSARLTSLQKRRRRWDVESTIPRLPLSRNAKSGSVYRLPYAMMRSPLESALAATRAARSSCSPEASEDDSSLLDRSPSSLGVMGTSPSEEEEDMLEIEGTDSG